MDRKQGLELLIEHRIIVSIQQAGRDDILPLAEALYDDGIRMIEVGFHITGSFYTLKELNKQLGSKMIIGAGTILDVADAKAATEAGAAFLSTPHTDKRVIRYGNKTNIPVYAGAATPTEVIRAWSAGAAAVRLFPITALGAAYVQQLLTLTPHIPLLAAGGVTAGNAREYLQAGCRAVVCDSSSRDGDEQQPGYYDEILRNASEWTAVVH